MSEIILKAVKPKAKTKNEHSLIAVMLIILGGEILVNAILTWNTFANIFVFELKQFK